MVAAKPFRFKQVKAIKDRVFLDTNTCKVWNFFLSDTAAEVNRNIYKLLYENTPYCQKYEIADYHSLSIVIADFLGPGLQVIKA